MTGYCNVGIESVYLQAPRSSERSDPNFHSILSS